MVMYATLPTLLPSALSDTTGSPTCERFGGAELTGGEEDGVSCEKGSGVSSGGISSSDGLPMTSEEL